MHGNSRAVDVEFADDGAAAAKAPQPQQTDQNVLSRVLIRQECLPTCVGCVVAPHQLHFLRLHLLVNVLHAATPTHSGQATYHAAGY